VFFQYLNTSAQDIGIEGSTQSPVAGHNHDQHSVSRTSAKKGMHGRTDPMAHPFQHLPHPNGIRPRTEDSILRSFELGSRDHLHGLGDLLSVFDRTDFSSKALKACHGLPE
jgi:hypothetical protein